jgi:hypothetical protein
MPEGEEPVKPLQIALLVVAGAVGGAIVMKVTERPQPAAPQVASPAPPASTQNPVETQALAPEAAAPTEPVERPSPLPERRAGPPAKAARRSAPKVAIAQIAPPDPVTAPPIQPPPASPEPPPPAPAPTEVATRPEPPAIPPPPPRQVTLNAGTQISVRLIDGLTTQRNNTGDTFTGSLDQPLVVDGLVIAERGARVEGRVVSADKGGKVSGVATLEVQLTRIHLSDGQAISVQSESFAKHAEQTRGTDAAKVGGGAAIGAIIGAIAGGGKGAAIGAGAGGGVGAGDVLLTRGKPAVLPSETRISFRLSTPVTITERRS